MATYQMTVTGEWDMSTGELRLGRVMCAFAAEGSVAAMETAHGLLTVLFTAPETQPVSLWRTGRPDATLTGVLAVEVCYAEPEDRAPLGFRCLLD